MALQLRHVDLGGRTEDWPAVYLPACLPALPASLAEGTRLPTCRPGPIGRAAPVPRLLLECAAPALLVSTLIAHPPRSSLWMPGFSARDCTFSHHLLFAYATATINGGGRRVNRSCPRLRTCSLPQDSMTNRGSQYFHAGTEPLLPSLVLVQPIRLVASANGCLRFCLEGDASELNAVCHDSR